MARKFVSQVAVVCSHTVGPPTLKPPSGPTHQWSTQEKPTKSHHPPTAQLMEIVAK